MSCKERSVQAIGGSVTASLLTSVIGESEN